MSSPLTRLSNSFIRYGMGSSFVLGVKLIFTYLALFLLNPLWAYLLVHVLIFFVSYKVHTVWSFRVQGGTTSMLSYLRTVLIFKAADYFIFSIVFSLFEIQALWCVMIATLFVAIIRYACVRRALEGSATIPSRANGSRY